MGGSKVQIGGPTGAFIVIIYGIIQQYGEAGLIVANAHGRCHPVLLGVFQTRCSHQVYPVSYHCRFHQRYRRYYFHYADCRYFRFVFLEVRKYREISSGSG